MIHKTGPRLISVWRSDGFWCALLGVAATGIYWHHAAPGLMFHDSGEFALLAACGGVGHPPGAPTYALLAWAWRHLLFWLDPVYTANLFSGLFGGVTVALGALLSTRWCRHVVSDPPLWQVRLAAGVAAIAILGVRAQCEVAGYAEQYTLMTAGWLAVLLLCPWQTVDSPFRRCLLAGLVLGLAAGNHPSQIVLIPALLLAGWWAAESWRSRLQAWGGGLLGTLIGVQVYWWVYFRAQQQPALNWWNASTPERFLSALMRKQWATRPMSEAPGDMIRLWFESYDWVNQVGIVVLVLGLTGLMIGLMRRCRPALLLTLTAVPYSMGMLYGHLVQATLGNITIVSYGVGDWHTIPFLTLAVAAPVAVSLTFTSRWRRQAMFLAVVCIGTITLRSFIVVGQESMRGNKDYDQMRSRFSLSGQPTMRLLLIDSFVMGEGYVAWRPGGSRDAVNLVMSISDHVRRTKSRRMTLSDLLSEQAKSDELMYPNARSVLRQAHGTVHTDASVSWDDHLYMEPVGVMFRIRETPLTRTEIRDHADQWMQVTQRALMTRPDHPVHRMTAECWSKVWSAHGAYYTRLNLCPQAARCFEEAIRWQPNVDIYWRQLGGVLMQGGRLQSARKALMQALQLTPRTTGVRRQLMLLAMKEGRPDEARVWMNEELALTPKGQRTAARREMERILADAASGPK